MPTPVCPPESPRPDASAAAAACPAAVRLPAQAQFGPQGPPAVGVITAERKPVTETSEFVGRIEAVNRVEIRARVTGFLQERLFREGQEVKAGDVLFRIERPPFEAQLAQAQASVASAQAQLENARVALARARELRSTGAGPQVNVDNAQAQERTASANLLAAQAQVRVAEINLGYTDIIAPIDGKIGRASLTPGNVVSPTLSDSLATIVSQDPMRVAFTVSARTSVELRNRYESRGGRRRRWCACAPRDGKLYPLPGAHRLRRPADRPQHRHHPGARTDPEPGAETVQRGDVGDRELTDGQFVSVSVEGAEPVQAIVIPRAAVLQDQGGTYVFVVGPENRATRRNVKLGRSTNAEQAVIEDGLAGGESVIAEGVQRVRPGQPVNPAPVGAPPGRPPGPPQAGGAPRG